MTPEEINAMMQVRQDLLEERERLLRSMENNTCQLAVINKKCDENNIPYNDWWPGIGFKKEKKACVKKVYMEGEPMHAPLPDLMKWEEPAKEKQVEVVIEEIPVEEVKIAVIRVRKKHERRDVNLLPYVHTDESEELKEIVWQKENESGFQFARYPDFMEEKRYSRK